MKIIRAIWPVLAGFLAVFILSSVTDYILENTGVFPSFAYQMENGSPTWVLVAALAYRSIYTILGGFITGKLAKTNPMKHVKMLALIGLVAGIIGVVGAWSLGQQWYPIVLMITGPLFVLLGGKIKKK